MGYALPSGVINTDSAYFYADATLAFGPLVKQPLDQTLVVLDFTTAAISIDSFDFTVDVSSNPKLVIAYPHLDSTGFILSFLLSGGISSQQYNISIVIGSSSGSHTYLLTINIPSSGDCACETINPVPALYTQLPLGSDGYVNSAARFFWGSAPPTNPNVMDQWYNASTQTLYERVSDGVDFFWRTLYSPNLVVDAPSSGLIYGRYNGFWVAEPIQADAPADGTQYARRNNAWYSMSQYITEAPGGVRFGRFNGTWQADAIQTDAPSNGNSYARHNGGWSVVPPFFPDAPSTGQLYSRINTNWMVTPIQTDAPPDGQFYARNNRTWIAIQVNDLLTDAPTDGTLYGRQSGGWVAAYPESNPLNYQTDVQLATALTPYARWQGGTFTGACSFPGLILPNGPATLQISGGAVGQILVRNVAGTLAWSPPSPSEAPSDGIAYARQNNTWVPTAAGAGVPEAPNDGSTYARNSDAWVTLIHTDITDWTATLAPYALISQIPLGSIIFPLMDGTNAIGTSTNWARADHVHPTDTSRYSVSNPANYQSAAQVSAALTPYALITMLPPASNAVPSMNGAAASGSSVGYSRADHVHPTDTTRAPASALGNYLLLSGGTMTGVLTLLGNPVGNLDAAPKQYVDNATIDCGTY